MAWAKKVQSGAIGHQAKSKEFARKWKERTVVTQKRLIFTVHWSNGNWKILEWGKEAEE